MALRNSYPSRWKRAGASALAKVAPCAHPTKDSREAAARFAGARAAGLRRRRDGAQIDAEAAAVILERWLAAADLAQPPLSSPSTAESP